MSETSLAGFARSYQPKTPGDWSNPKPTTIAEGLDDLAASAGPGGGVPAVVFDPKPPGTATTNIRSDRSAEQGTITGAVVGVTQLGSALAVGPIASDVSADYGTVGGGGGNSVHALAGTVCGGQGNAVTAAGGTVGGGGGNTCSAVAATIGGGLTHTGGGVASTIAGGESNTTAGTHDAIGGGGGNNTGSPGGYNTCAGGHNNRSQGDACSVGGGDTNVADGGSPSGTIAGGDHNLLHSAQAGSIGGGSGNTIGNGALATDGSTIGGGTGHTIGGAALSANATIGGGTTNTIDGSGGTIAGGNTNAISTAANATIGGGTHNQATGDGATVPGGDHNHAGDVCAIAMGMGALSPRPTQQSLAGDLDNGGASALAQRDVIVLRGQGAGQAGTPLRLGPASVRFVAEDAHAYHFQVNAIASNRGAGGPRTSVSIIYEIVASCDGGVLTIEDQGVDSTKGNAALVATSTIVAAVVAGNELEVTFNTGVGGDAGTSYGVAASLEVVERVLNP